MERSLSYLREVLAIELENDDQKYHPLCKQIFSKLNNRQYDNEEQFLDDLDEEEAEYLNKLLEHEIHYAYQAQDEVRLKELNDIYERLI